MRRVPLIALALLPACGSRTDPRSANRVQRMAAADTSVLVFTGTKVALRDLFEATDAYGRPVTDARFSCSLPAGFSRLAGDSLLAPAVETRGTLRCSATTAPS